MVSSATHSTRAAVRSDWPMWFRYQTRVPMQARTRTMATRTASPGTDSLPEVVRTSRMASSACANVPAKRPIAV
jgi:hypothetical protein